MKGWAFRLCLSNSLLSGSVSDGPLQKTEPETALLRSFLLSNHNKPRFGCLRFSVTVGIVVIIDFIVLGYTSRFQ